jgi:pyruvate,water dikinase
MPHIKPFNEISKKDIPIAGGKGASLGEMTNAGLAVPPGFVVLANAFDRFLEETKLKEEIVARFKKVNPEDINSVDKASNVIRDAIHDHEMPEDLTKEILEAFDELFTSPSPSPSKGDGKQTSLTERLVAVRSSATAEDSAVASWAGELETYLNITRENVVERVKQCWSSLFTPRAIFYRHEKKMIDHYVSVAVVIQKMIQSEISGIAFTVHPVTEDPDQMIIEAGFGLGEAIVSGQITPDSYVVSKSDMSIMDINIGSQGRMLVRSTKDVRNTKDTKLRNENNKWVELNKDVSEKQKLTGKQIIEVAKVCKKIEEHYKFPCDIEWAMENGQIYITQSRPITTLRLTI